MLRSRLKCMETHWEQGLSCPDFNKKYLENCSLFLHKIFVGRLSEYCQITAIMRLWISAQRVYGKTQNGVLIKFALAQNQLPQLINNPPECPKIGWLFDCKAYGFLLKLYSRDSLQIKTFNKSNEPIIYNNTK